jgi:hypothetical protein
MSTTWILIAVLALRLGGNDVKFQEFSSQERCEAAVAYTADAIRKHGNDSGFKIFCLNK